MRIKFNNELVKIMSLFQAVTRTNLKDAIDDGQGPIVFIVPPGEVARAVGKAGSNAKLMEHKLNRKIKIVEFNPQLIPFVENIIHPLKASKMEDKDGTIIISPPDHQTRGLLIGRNASNLRKTESIVKRYFEIKEIKVI